MTAVVIGAVTRPLAREPIERQVHDGRREQRQHLRQQEPADDGNSQRPAQLTACAMPQRQRQAAEHRRQRGHEDGAEAEYAGLMDRLDRGEPLIALRLDSEVGLAVGTLKVNSTGALDKWEPQSCNIRGAKGVHDLYLTFFGSGAPLMNVDWWKLEN